MAGYMTCATCRHAMPVDPNGYFRTRHGQEAYPTTHVHCGKQELPYGTVIPKVSRCWFMPSKWEEIS